MNRATLDTMAKVSRNADRERNRARELAEGEYDRAEIAAATAIAHALLAIDGRLKALAFALMMESEEELARSGGGGS